MKFTISLKSRVTLKVFCIGFFLIVTSTFSQLYSQSDICETPDPTPELMQYLRNQAPNTENYRALNSGRNSVNEVPVHFTIIKKSNGTGNTETQSTINSGLNLLNEEFANAGLHFYQLGKTDYVESDVLFNNPIPFLNNFTAYGGTAVNVISQNIGNYSTVYDPMNVNPTPDNIILGANRFCANMSI